jgi:Mrp family chromosome partitioning ATPase
VTIEGVEARVHALADKGQLIFGSTGRRDGAITHATTPEHIAEERHLLAIDAGRAPQGCLLLIWRQRAFRSRRACDRSMKEQLGAGILALSSSDRVVVIQGVAGAGKTTLISALAEVAAARRQVLGLAQANTMVEMLKREAGIEAQTVSSFVNQHLMQRWRARGPLTPRAMLKDTIWSSTKPRSSPTSR